MQWLTLVLVFPLTFASTVFVPAEGMNPILAVFALNQPIMQVVEAVRALVLVEPIGNHGRLSVARSVSIVVLALAFAVCLYAAARPPGGAGLLSLPLSEHSSSV